MGAREATHVYRLHKWIEIVSQCRSSGKTVKAWCEGNGVNIKSYYYWQRKVREAAIKALPACWQSAKETSAGIQPMFTELELPKTNSAARIAATIRFHEAVIEIQNGADPMVVENAFRVLKSL